MPEKDGSFPLAWALSNSATVYTLVMTETGDTERERERERERGGALYKWPKFYMVAGNIVKKGMCQYTTLPK